MKIISIEIKVKEQRDVDKIQNIIIKQVQWMLEEGESVKFIVNEEVK